MKHLIKPLLTALLLLCSAVINAHDFRVDGIYYNILSEEDKTVEVTYRGSSSSSYSNEYSGSVVIPKEVSYKGGSYKVTSIKSSAFSGCSGLTSIEIPSSVTSIGRWAFNGCSGLERISIDVNNSHYDSRDNCNAIIEIATNTLIAGCKNTVIPNTITSIGSWAFDGCSSLTSITIPNSVTSIGNDAFYGCSSLTSIEIPSSVTSIGDRAFSYCSGLTSIEIPSSVTSIGEWAFGGCSGLTEIFIPSSVTSIGECAFEGCSGLTEIVSNIPSYNLFAQSAFSFFNCTLYVPAGAKETYKETAGWGFSNIVECKKCGDNVYCSFNEATGELTIEGTGAMYNDNNTTWYPISGQIKSVDIKSGVTSISSWAFMGCSDLASIVIPEGVTSIGNSAFEGCSGLTSIEIPSSVTSIGSWAFIGCKALSKIVSNIPAEDLFIPGDNAFLYIDKETCILYVPKGSKAAYISTEDWEDFKNIVEIKTTYKVTFVVDDKEFTIDSVAEGDKIIYPEIPEKEGYTFMWDTNIDIMPSNDITITGKYVANSYLLTYKIDGNVYASDSIAYGTTITPIAAPTKEGHTFSGWSEIPATMPANDVVIEGSFSINSYNITYKVDGEIYATDSIKYGATIEPIEAPTKEGHSFSGWSEIPETMPANDVIIEGTFSVNSYTLTYKVDGAVYKTETVAYGATITTIAAPTKEGHTFSGWSEIPATMPANDVVIEGSFSINSYTVTFMVDGEVYETMTVEYGATITPIAAPTKEGHTFSGWSDIPRTMPAKTVIVNGSFTPNSYTVTFKVDGAEYKVISVVYGTAIPTIEAPTKEGHTFSGWSEIPETMPANDVVIEGTFSVNSYLLTYKVDGEVYETVTVEYGATITPIAEPTKEGHTFSGWSEIPETMPAKDIVVEGSFTVNSYLLTYKVDGKIYATDSIKYGSTIEPIAEPTKEGHTFSGWSEIPATMPANDIVIEGSFSINSYTVTFMVDGEVYETMTVAYGATITSIEAPTKEGHTFSGWSEIPETMPAKDVVVEGTFSVNSYILTYKVDGAVYKTETIEYGATITTIEAPTKEGHTFSGWSEIPATMPANDIVVEGSFSVNSYLLTYKVDGEIYATDSIKYGATIEPIAAPTKEGHTFSGWSEIPETMPANDVVVEGTFSINSYTVTFMVNGEVYETMTVEYSAEIELPTPPEKEGYIFTGWIGVPATMPAEDIVIEGRFEVDTTGINAVTLDLEKNEVYNLKGQRITESENITRGIYIVNGKKVYIK